MWVRWWTIWDPLCCHVYLHECKYVVLKNEALCNHLPAKSLVVVQKDLACCLAFSIATELNIGDSHAKAIDAGCVSGRPVPSSNESENKYSK